VDRSCAPSCSPIPEDYEALRIALHELGVETLTAKYEAEALCSYLVSIGKVQAVISEDSDCAAYLAFVLLNCNSNDECILNTVEACRALELSCEQFQDLCVLLGNDFNERIKGIGPEKAWMYMKKKKSLLSVLDYLNVEDPLRTQMIATKQLFTSWCHEKFEN
jgi:flap endonuclease-1